MFKSLRKKDIVEDLVMVEEIAEESETEDSDNPDVYCVDITPIIDFVDNNQIESADTENPKYDFSQAWHFSVGGSYDKYITLRFADKIISIKTSPRRYASNSPDQLRSSLLVYNRNYSQQLDLFNHVPAFCYVGSIDATDITSGQYYALVSKMSKILTRHEVEIKKQRADGILKEFSR